jgi:hypothetical protein
VSSNAIKHSLVIRSVNGEQPIIYPRHENEWNYIAYWLSNEWLAIVNENSSPDSLILLNPFTGQKQTLIPDYPDMTIDEYMWRFWPTIASYDPTLTRVVYVGHTSSTGNELVLWDRQSKQAVVKIPHNQYAEDHPRWAPDGKSFVFTRTAEDASLNLDELALVSWDGEITPLTNLTAYYPEVSIKTYRWSPDGRYLAFWLATKVSEDPNSDWKIEFAILNMNDLTVINYCIRTYDNFPNTIWSPDSRYLAIEVVDKDESTHAILVDTMDKYAALIADGVIPSGWMVNEK